MFKRNHISVAIAATALLITSYASAETATATATVTVQNTFTLASTTALSFGIMRITQPGAQATLTPFYVTVDNTGAIVASGGTGTVTPADDASGNVISGHAAALFTISGAAPSTALTLTVEAGTEFDGTAGTAGMITGMNDIPILDSVSNPFFTLHADFSHTLASNTGAALDVTGVGLETDASGDATLTIGGILVYNFDNAASPASETFTGDYAITLNY
jgi:hypothetical protein